MMLKLAHFPVALYLCSPLANAEASTYKCTDGRGITYANVPCEDMNLKSAGPIKSLVTVLPATEDAEDSDKTKNGEDSKTTHDKASVNKHPVNDSAEPDKSQSAKTE